MRHASSLSVQVADVRGTNCGCSVYGTHLHSASAVSRRQSARHCDMPARPSRHPRCNSTVPMHPSGGVVPRGWQCVSHPLLGVGADLVGGLLRRRLDVEVDGSIDRQRVHAHVAALHDRELAALEQ